MDWNGCSKPTNGISPCSSPQHGYLSTSTPRRWPNSTLGHVGWLLVEPHRCFRFDSWRCSIWHIVCVSGTWNNAWYNVIWIDRYPVWFDMLIECFTKWNIGAVEDFPHLQFCSWAKQYVCVFSTQELLLFPWTARLTNMFFLSSARFNKRIQNKVLSTG